MSKSSKSARNEPPSASKRSACCTGTAVPPATVPVPLSSRLMPWYANASTVIDLSAHGFAGSGTLGPYFPSPSSATPPDLIPM
jgi:hypothetical protein